MAYQFSIGFRTYLFNDLKALLAKASPCRSGDELAGLAAETYEERVAAQMALAEVPLNRFLQEVLIPYEEDEITRLIIDTHDADAFIPVSSFTVGELRDWLLSDAADSKILQKLSPGLTPEMVAAVCKLMRNQDLILVASKCEVITKFRNTLGLKGHLSTRLQPNHPTDDLKGIAAVIVDGLLYGSGDAVIGINPATDSPAVAANILYMLDGLRGKLDMPVQNCVLSHITTTIGLVEKGVPVDLVFQSIAGTQKANESFGINLNIIKEGYEAGLSLSRGTNQLLYFETGQGSALSANANFGVDQQTCEARAYGMARAFNPFMLNSVVGFIGPEYLYDGKQIIRAGLEDHFCGKLLGIPMGMDVCYTNHTQADQDDMETLVTLLGVAGINFIMGIPGSDDTMLNYQTTSFHDALYVRKVLGLRPAPEFEDWLIRQGIMDTNYNRLNKGIENINSIFNALK